MTLADYENMTYFGMSNAAIAGEDNTTVLAAGKDYQNRIG
jgi:hypothetical protein